MKEILLFFTLFSATAYTEEDDSILPKLIEKATISTLKGVAPEYVVKNLTGDIQKFARTGLNVYLTVQDIEALRNSKTDSDKIMNSLILGTRLYSFVNEKAAPYVSYLQIGKSILDYGKAETERDKYFAALSTGAAIASFFPFGWLAQIGVMQQQLNDIWVTKSYIPLIEGKMEENNRLGVTLREKMLERANGEWVYISTLITRAQLHIIASQAIVIREERECKFDQKDLNQLIVHVHGCAENEKDFYYTMAMAAKLFRAVVHEKFQLITMSDINKIYKWESGELEKLIAETEESVKKLDEELLQKEEAYRFYILRIQNGKTILDNKEENDRLACLELTKKDVTPLVVRLKNGNAPSAAEKPMLKRQLIEAQTHFEKACGNLKNVPRRTQDLLGTLSSQMQIWNKRL